MIDEPSGSVRMLAFLESGGENGVDFEGCESSEIGNGEGMSDNEGPQRESSVEIVEEGDGGAKDGGNGGEGSDEGGNLQRGRLSGELSGSRGKLPRELQREWLRSRRGLRRLERALRGLEFESMIFDCHTIAL